MLKQVFSMRETGQSSLRGYKFPGLPVKNALAKRIRICQKNRHFGFDPRNARAYDIYFEQIVANCIRGNYS